MFEALWVGLICVAAAKGLDFACDWYKRYRSMHSNPNESSRDSESAAKKDLSA